MDLQNFGGVITGIDSIDNFYDDSYTYFILPDIDDFGEYNLYRVLGSGNSYYSLFGIFAVIYANFIYCIYNCNFLLCKVYLFYKYSIKQQGFPKHMSKYIITFQNSRSEFIHRKEKIVLEAKNYPYSRYNYYYENNDGFELILVGTFENYSTLQNQIKITQFQLKI